MSRRRVAVRVTANFERNLDEIRAFLVEAGAEAAFPALVDDLFENAVATLERFPEMGVDLLARAPLSTEGHALVDKLRRLMGGAASLRQYVFGDYLSLYALRDNALYLLSIRHHRQLSFDFKTHWR